MFSFFISHVNKPFWGTLMYFIQYYPSWNIEQILEEKSDAFSRRFRVFLREYCFLLF